MLKIITSKRFKAMVAETQKQAADIHRLKTELRQLEIKFEQERKLKEEAQAKRKEYAEDNDRLRKKAKKAEDDKAKCYKENRHLEMEINRLKRGY